MIMQKKHEMAFYDDQGVQNHVPSVEELKNMNAMDFSSIDQR